MDIFDDIFLSLPCPDCGDTREIPLRDIELSQGVMHDGCPDALARECPQVVWQDLIDPVALREFLDAWRRLQASAAASGGSLRVRANEAPFDSPAPPP